MDTNQLQKKIIKNYDENYRNCRDIGHVWHQVTAKMGGGQLYRTLKCQRCTSERHEMFAKSGELLSRHYYHADNYLLKAEDGFRYTKQFWRGLAYLQATDKTKETS